MPPKGKKKSKPPPTYAVSPEGHEILGERQRLLKSTGETYKVLGAACRVGKNTISDLLNGYHVTAPYLDKLCRRLGVSLYRVLNGIDGQQAALLDEFERIRAHGADEAEEAIRSLHLRANGLGPPGRPPNPATRDDR